MKDPNITNSKYYVNKKLQMLSIFYKTIEKHIPLSDEDKELIKHNVIYQRLNPKELFIDKGEIADKVGFIVKGIFRHYFVDDQRAKVTLSFFMENDFFTNISSFTQKTQSKGALQSETFSEIIVISRDAWDIFATNIPRWREAMIAITNDILVKLTNFQKIIINKDATKAYLALDDFYPTIIHRVPLSDIATFLGIKQSTLSRIRNQISKSE